MSFHPCPGLPPPPPPTTASSTVVEREAYIEWGKAACRVYERREKELLARLEKIKREKEMQTNMTFREYLKGLFQWSDRTKTNQQRDEEEPLTKETKQK